MPVLATVLSCTVLGSLKSVDCTTILISKSQDVDYYFRCYAKYSTVGCVRERVFGHRCDVDVCTKTQKYGTHTATRQIEEIEL
jgi:hypothetical protein